jgi:hypothetical protein
MPLRAIDVNLRMLAQHASAAFGFLRPEKTIVYEGRAARTIK